MPSQETDGDVDASFLSVFLRRSRIKQANVVNSGWLASRCRHQILSQVQRQPLGLDIE